MRKHIVVFKAANCSGGVYWWLSGLPGISSCAYLGSPRYRDVFEPSFHYKGTWVFVIHTEENITTKKLCELLNRQGEKWFKVKKFRKCDFPPQSEWYDPLHY